MLDAAETPRVNDGVVRPDSGPDIRLDIDTRPIIRRPRPLLAVPTRGRARADTADEAVRLDEGPRLRLTEGVPMPRCLAPESHDARRQPADTMGLSIRPVVPETHVPMCSEGGRRRAMLTFALAILTAPHPLLVRLHGEGIMGSLR